MRMQNCLVAAGIGAALCLSASNSLAQNNGGGGGGGGRGRQRNIDPAQREQQMMDRYKEVLEVNNDDEWNAMKPMIQKVMDARRESFAGGMGRGMFGGRRGGAGGGGGDQGGGNGNGNGMRRGPGGEPSPAARGPAEGHRCEGQHGRDQSRPGQVRRVPQDQRRTIENRAGELAQGADGPAGGDRHSQRAALRRPAWRAVERPQAKHRLPWIKRSPPAQPVLNPNRTRS